jgi:primosomal protein N' (replication factor Y)
MREEDSLVPVGPGVERIADEVAALFPDARTAIVTSDTIWSPAKAAEFVARMEAGAIDIVVGTQLVTKGYHFPQPDAGRRGRCRSRPLRRRPARRRAQLPADRQVAGRAGRGEKPGRVLVQTHEPGAPVISALVSGDAEGFYEAETDAGAKPRCRPSAASPASSSRPRTWRSHRDRPPDRPHRAARRGMAVFGPAPAPLAMLRGRHRQRLLVHAARSLDVQDVIRDWLGKLEWPRGVRVAVDVDPYVRRARRRDAAVERVDRGVLAHPGESRGVRRAHRIAKVLPVRSL